MRTNTLALVLLLIVPVLGATAGTAPPVPLREQNRQAYLQEFGSLWDPLELVDHTYNTDTGTTTVTTTMEQALDWHLDLLDKYGIPFSDSEPGMSTMSTCGEEPPAPDANGYWEHSCNVWPAEGSLWFHERGKKGEATCPSINPGLPDERKDLYAALDLEYDPHYGRGETTVSKHPYTVGSTKFASTLAIYPEATPEDSMTDETIKRSNTYLGLTIDFGDIIDLRCTVSKFGTRFMHDSYVYTEALKVDP